MYSYWEVWLLSKHLSLSLEKFIQSISWNHFQQYFDKIKTRLPNKGWEFINADAMQHFLDDPENTEVAGIILEDFQRINDIGQEGMGILVRTCRKYDIIVASDETPLQLSMRLFLDHPFSFEFSWSRYLLYNTPSRLSIYPLPTVKILDINSTQIHAFKASVQQWFTELAKGDQCIVNSYEDQGETVILVRHGSYIRAVPFWEGNAISVNSYRPAIEDVLVHDPTKSQLFIKATLAKDRETYLRLFAFHIIGDASVADQAIKAEMFTLTPLQEGKFNFAGGGPITKIELVKVRMKLYGVSNPIIELRADDVPAAFQNDLGSLTLNSGTLNMARFCFHLCYPGRRAIKVTFEIDPPSRTDLTQKKYAQVIEDYLLQQGVKLH
jgi:hypothetical protein